MNYLELKNRLTAISHRPDLASELPYFISDCNNRLNVRFSMANPELTADTDTNEILTSFPQLYITGSLQALYEFLNNGDNAIYYNQRFNEECDRANTSGYSTSATDPSYGQPLYIRAEEF